MIAYLLSWALERLVIDTNVLTGALIGRSGWNRRVIRVCLEGLVKPIIGQPLFLEYEDVLSRRELFRRSPLSRTERQELFMAFLSVCEWVQVYYAWRPNLRDEADNHIMELAIAGGAAIVTNNVSDFLSAELRFPELRVLTPRRLLEELR